MMRSALRLYVKIHVLRDALKDETGQDLVEYALVMGLIAMGAVAGVKGFATAIGTGLTSVGTKMTTYTS